MKHPLENIPPPPENPLLGVPGRDPGPVRRFPGFGHTLAHFRCPERDRLVRIGRDAFPGAGHYQLVARDRLYLASSVPVSRSLAWSAGHIRLRRLG